MGLVRTFIEGFAAHADGPTPESMRAATSALYGSIPLISSRGIERRATYRMIYLTNPWVYAATNKLARDIARLPLHTFQMEAEGRRRRVRGDIPTSAGRPGAGEQLDRIFQQPDPSLSRSAFWLGATIDRLIYGNSVSRKMREGGVINGLERRAWRTVNHVDQEDGKVKFYEFQPKGSFARPERLVPDDVIHFGRGADPEDAIAPSPLEACKYTIALYEGVVRHLINFFANQASPSGHIKVDNLSKDKAKLIRELITEAYASPENAGKVVVTSGEWESIGVTPDHGKVVELIQLSRNEVATVYGVPPPVLGIMEHAVKANVKELREQYVREGLGPWVTEFEDDLMAQLVRPVPTWRFLFSKFQLAEQLRPDLEARAIVYQRLKHIYSPDEIRQFEDMQPLDLPGISDVPWVDSGAQPMSAWKPKPKKQSEPSTNGHKEPVEVIA